VGSITSGNPYRDRAPGGVWVKASETRKIGWQFYGITNFILFREKFYSVAISEGDMSSLPCPSYAPETVNNLYIAVTFCPIRPSVHTSFPFNPITTTARKPS